MDIGIISGSEAANVDPQNVPWPVDSLVAIARNPNGEIKGRSAIIQLPHIEGTWVADSERGSTLAFQLVHKIESVLKESGKTHAFAFVDIAQSEILGYMLRMGYKVSPLLVVSKEL